MATKSENKKGYFLMIIKYLFSIIITFLAYKTTRNVRYLPVGFAELVFIAVLSNILLGKSRKSGLWVNNILVLLYNIQMLMAFFGNSFVVLVMLENVESLEDLSGKALEYGSGALLLIIFSFLPVCKIKFLLKKRFLFGAAALELCFLLVWGNIYSPLYGIYALGVQEYEAFKTHSFVANADKNTAPMFYKDKIEDFRRKDSILPEKPNVILILTEGLSSNAVYDERSIMPNLNSLMDKSLNFTGYYNHTFATYRGIIGQLYSGYQNNNLDSNSLISLQEILQNEGYNTFFVNAEPHNILFTEYLKSLKFDEIAGSADNNCSGPANSMTDKEIYELLFDTAVTANEKEAPFFITMYSFGTHASLNSADEIFDNGKSRMLNRFYNLDCQLGKFLEKFENSSLFDDTVIVFTADHAAYADNDFQNAFPDYDRLSTVADEIPLLIYYKGVKTEVVDAEGRNTLDLAPTLLDFLDISSPNYFLGTSLFSDEDNLFDKVFHSDSNVYYSSEGKEVTALSKDNTAFVKPLIRKYYIAAQKGIK